MTSNTDPRPIPGFQLLGQDGNAFALLGQFQRCARRAGWTPEEIATVRDEATAGDYDHLLSTLIPYEDYGDE